MARHTYPLGPNTTAADHGSGAPCPAPRPACRATSPQRKSPSTRPPGTYAGVVSGAGSITKTAPATSPQRTKYLPRRHHVSARHPDRHDRQPPGPTSPTTPASSRTRHDWTMPASVGHGSLTKAASGAPLTGDNTTRCSQSAGPCESAWGTTGSSWVTSSQRIPWVINRSGTHASRRTLRVLFAHHGRQRHPHLAVQHYSGATTVSQGPGTSRKCRARLAASSMTVANGAPWRFRTTSRSAPSRSQSSAPRVERRCVRNVPAQHFRRRVTCGCHRSTPFWHADLDRWNHRLAELTVGAPALSVASAIATGVGSLTKDGAGP